MSSQAFTIITQKSLLLDKSFSLEVISRLQLSQNSKILHLCFRRRLPQNRHGSDWNITVRVILVSPYSVHELPLPNCTRRYLLETISHRLVQSKQKRHQTASHSSAMIFLLLTSNKLGCISSLAQNICQSNQIFRTGTCSRSAFNRLLQYLCCASLSFCRFG